MLLHDFAPLKNVANDPASYTHTAVDKGGTGGDRDEDVSNQTPLHWERLFWDSHINLLTQRALCCEDAGLLNSSE